MTKIFRFAIILALAAVVAAGALAAAAAAANRAPLDMPDEYMFRVSKGDTAYRIGENLEDAGLVRNGRLFAYYSRFKGTSGEMKSGLYRISGGMGAISIHDKLLSGAEELYPVTVPPGLTANDVAAIFEESGITDEDSFLEAVGAAGAEGKLFPDTYNFPLDYPADKIVGFMTDTFRQRLEEIYPEYGELSDEEIRDRIIMASIVEREYRNEDEASKMASVFYNRIDADMYLGSCATVVYVIMEELGKPHPERLFYRDLELESPYNTYKHKGLPPGPICNPGATAIDAAFNPADTDYLYFLLEDPETGRHGFTRSLSEHNRSYELYIKRK